MKRKLAALALVTGVLAWTWTSAQAHALLLRSNPAANATLEKAPRFVELVYSEALEPSFSSASLLNVSGMRLDNNDANVDPTDPTRMTLTLLPLPDGVYTVTWKVLSAVDGHGSTGALAFVVGSGGQAPGPIAPSPVGTKLPAPEVIARWLLYLGAAILTGGTVFLLAVWQPAVHAWIEAGETPPLPTLPWPALARLGAGVFLFANLLGWWAQAAQAVGGVVSAPWDPAMGTVLFTTRFGALWSARLLLGLGLAAWLPRSRSTFAQLASIVVAGALLLDISFGSHAASEASPALPILGDWLHMLAASIWVGGLVYFIAGLLALQRMSPQPRTKLVAGLIPRFSRLALPTVAFLAATGVYAAVLRVGSWPGLLGTPYGRTLLAKILIALTMVGFGALNLLVVSPRMRRGASRVEGASGLLGTFGRFVTTEVLLGCAALLAAGVLTSQAPARAPTSPAFLAVQGTGDDLRVVLEITPGRVGPNTFAATLTSGGSPVIGAKEVRLRFTPTTDVPPSQVVLVESEQGRYTGQGTYLSLPDRWQVQVAVRREGEFDSFADLFVDLRPSEAALNLAWPRLTGGLLTLAGLLGWAAIRRPQIGLPAQILRALPAAALSIAGVAVLARPLPARSLLNPVPPSSASVAAGQALYQQYCVVCHGTGGKGDGPWGLTLNPRPADLTLHTIPGVHSDGQLYEWITNGYQGSVMPAWKERLSDTLRWDLVNYLRTLAPSTLP